MGTASWVAAVKSVRYARQVANWRAVGAAARRGEEVTRLQLRNGLVIDGGPGVGIEPLYKEIWYRDVYRLRAEPLRPGATVIEIGANIGMFALYAAVVAHAARVLSYEPFAESFALLRRNIEQNHATAIQAFQLGVAATRGQRTLNLYTCPGWNSLYGAAGAAAVAIECVTLADVFEQHQIACCDFLKLDCEGAEFEILLTAPPALLARVQRIGLEYHDTVTPHTHDELAQLFRGTGFAVHVVGGARTGYLFATRRPT